MQRCKGGLALAVGAPWNESERLAVSVTCRTLQPRASACQPSLAWLCPRCLKSVCLLESEWCLFVSPFFPFIFFPFHPLGVSMPLAFTLIRSPLKYHLLKWSSLIILVKGAEHSSHLIMLFCFLHPLDFFVSSYVNQMPPWNGIRASKRQRFCSHC